MVCQKIEGNQRTGRTCDKDDGGGHRGKHSYGEEISRDDPPQSRRSVAFNPIRESRTSDDQLLPLILEPAADQVDLADWARSNRDYINAKLHKHGGILVPRLWTFDTAGVRAGRGFRLQGNLFRVR